MPVLVGLDGVVLGREDAGHTTQFHFTSEDDACFALDLVTVLHLLHATQQAGLLPSLGNDWFLMLAGSYGAEVYSPHDPSVLNTRPYDPLMLLHLQQADQDYLLPVATLLQCLEIAQADCCVPPLQDGWLDQVLPQAYRIANLDALPEP